MQSFHLPVQENLLILSSWSRCGVSTLILKISEDCQSLSIWHELCQGVGILSASE